MMKIPAIKKINIKGLKNRILIAICGVLTVLTVLLTVTTATTGFEMSRLESQKSILLEERRGLEESLVKTLSTRELEDESGDLGFAKPENIVYISGMPPVANLPQ